MNIESKRREADNLEKKKEEILDQWHTIDSEQSNLSEDRFLIISDTNNIYSKILQMWRESSDEILSVFTPVGFAQAQKRGVLDNIISISSEKRDTSRWCSKLILDFSERHIEAVKRHLNKTLAKHAKIEWRYADLSSNSHLRFVIKDAKEALFFLTNLEKSSRCKREVCFWTNSEPLVLAFKTIHETMWPTTQHVAKHIQNIEAKKSIRKPRVKKNQLTPHITKNPLN
jgi:hypothetical protein